MERFSTEVSRDLPLCAESGVVRDPPGVYACECVGVNAPGGYETPCDLIRVVVSSLTPQTSRTWGSRPSG